MKPTTEAIDVASTGADAVENALAGSFAPPVLPRLAVEEMGLASIGLARVEELAGAAVSYAQLADRVRAAGGGVSA